MRCAVVVMAKAPVPGQAKTRLIPALGADGAARVAAAGLDATLAAARDAALGPVLLAAAPHARHPALQRWAGQVDTVDQPEADLGARMQAAVQAGLSLAEAALVVGTDAPALDAARLREAAAALQRAPVVLVPTFDGGYVGVGVHGDAWRRQGALRGALFDPLPWSTPAVLSATQARLAACGVTPALLPPVHDIDTPDDLAWLPAHWQRDTPR
ncbi:TIGR04282 family arsenosugar biosynthesis glycosyltransferase [Rubrivivax albus]|uniref:DUF2064 domain-containing protein n=1 Tax=Rubrivivax albus TaxID=2499835 RepID=A0A3S2TK38_9BURK|nr:TIGR04282 family arsenosugar biosynthesis glycosyltransferase [Rubrivivax albus]RVT49361.1 DUF2064 domain-containing protein [Rubrivivax albus]